MASVSAISGNVSRVWEQPFDRGQESWDEDGPARSFGELIRFYRRRLRQIHNGEPWSQEDLAVAIGSDKSHINRIERGRQRPCSQTLQRICDALDLSWPERSFLMSLTGQTFAPPSPTEAECEAAVRHARPLLQTLGHPAALLDIEGRHWDVNDLLAYAYYGYRGRDACMADLRGARNIEQLLNPRFATLLQKVIVNYDEYIYRQVARFWRVFRDRQERPEYQAILKRLLAVEPLRAVWMELWRDGNQPKPGLFLDHQFLTVQSPQVGRYTVQIWHSAFAFDDRFVLVQHMPADAATQRLFADLTARFDRAMPPPARMAISQAVTPRSWSTVSP